MPLKSINVSTTGLVQLAPGALLRTSNGVVESAVSNIPPILRLNPQNPSQPLTAADTIQTVTGTIGGNPAPFPTDHLETGANFHVTVAWSDGVTVSNPSSVVISAGEHGDPHREPERLDPAVDCQARHRAGAHCADDRARLSLSRTGKVCAPVTATVTVAIDPSISLRDSQTSGSFSLGQTTASVSTIVVGNNFEAPIPPPTFVEPEEIAAAPPPAAPPALQSTRCNWPARSNSYPSKRTRSMRNSAWLLLVKVGADGQEQQSLPASL